MTTINSPFQVEERDAANPVVRASNVLEILCAQIDASTGITASKRKAGAKPKLNATKTSLVWDQYGSFVGSSVVGPETLVG